MIYIVLGFVSSSYIWWFPLSGLRADVGKQINWQAQRCVLVWAARRNSRGVMPVSFLNALLK